MGSKISRLYVATEGETSYASDQAELRLARILNTVAPPEEEVKMLVPKIIAESAPSTAAGHLRGTDMLYIGVPFNRYSIYQHGLGLSGVAATSAV